MSILTLTAEASREANEIMNAIDIYRDMEHDLALFENGE